jgi:hypothetical protein
MMNGGNILTLQRILVHSCLAMTMRYAHLAPEHLQEAVKLNPLWGSDCFVPQLDKQEKPENPITMRLLANKSDKKSV